MSNSSWPIDARRDRLIGDWYIYQRVGGHRTSTDDLITAWFAVSQSRSPPTRYLDLGCGIGSVLLMVCHRLRPALARGIEAQPQSALMAQRSIDELPPTNVELSIELSDFRDVDFGADAYDLITGSPPYFPLHTGVLPADGQRRAARFEERGGIEAYMTAAARALATDGRFFLVHQTRSAERVLKAAESNHLFLHGRGDFLMSATRREPFLSVFEFARSSPAAQPAQRQYTIRDELGKITQEYQTLRRQLGVE